MLFNRKKHTIPKFPPEIAATFHQHCEAIDTDQLDELRRELGVFIKVSLEKTDYEIDQTTLNALYDRSLLLLDLYPSRNNKEKSIIIGAIRYFAFAADPFPEEVFATGYNDDVKIMNHVLEELGLESHAIELSS